MHFEQLWEQSENNFKNNTSSAEEVLNSLLLKVNLYQTLSEKIKAASPEEAAKIKSHLMGEILITLTHLSYRENINVFHSLKTSLDFFDIESFKEKWDSVS